MNYLKWNYSLNQELNQNIINLIKTEDIPYIKDFLDYLQSNQKNFLFIHGDKILLDLLEFQHFDIVEELFSKQFYHFDKKFAEQCSFSLGIQFNKSFFDYWKNKTQQLDKSSQYSVYRKFWYEFFSYQFFTNEDITNNIPHLEYVFDKIPFYTQSTDDIVNGYLINSRKNFLTQGINNLSQSSQSLLLQQITLLCGLHYSEFKSTFQEEFKQFPDLFDMFDKANLYQKMNNTLKQKTSFKKAKI